MSIRQGKNRQKFCRISKKAVKKSIFLTAFDFRAYFI